jgi:exoribonuclease-2
MTAPPAPSSIDLRAIARQVMLAHGFLVDFPLAAITQANQAAEPPFDRSGLRDLTGWLWSSIDNDDSRDLDQIEYVQPVARGTCVYVAVANVDWFAASRSAIDAAAQQNTTSIYTGVQTFPMLPERLSTGLTSLLEGQKRLAVVIEFSVAGDGTVQDSAVYPAVVQNKAQLTYNAVATWLQPNAVQQNDVRRNDVLLNDVRQNAVSSVTLHMLEKIRSNPDLQKQLLLQDQVAQKLRERRHESGALTLETSEFQPVVAPDGSFELKSREINRATQLIEEFMIAANQTTVGSLQARGLPCLRRVVRTPKRWDRIVELATAQGAALPPEPDSKSLEAFLKNQRQAHPDRFADLSLSVIKLLGRGEYVVSTHGQKAPGRPRNTGSLGHFALAVENYSHSTAPNRRYPDLLTQRFLLAAFNKKPAPYAIADLQSLAQHCTDKEDDANKVERSVHKSIAAVALTPHIGEMFPGIITGASEKGIWVRILHPAVEGKLTGKAARLDVGDKVQVRLTLADPERGYIDFVLIKRIDA